MEYNETTTDIVVSPIITQNILLMLWSSTECIGSDTVRVFVGMNEAFHQMEMI